GRAGRCQRAMRRAGAAAEHRGYAGHQRLFDLLRADEVDMGVDAAGRHYSALPGDHLRPGPDDDVDPWLDIGIAGLADAGDQPVLQTEIRLHDAPVVDDQGIGDDGIDGTFGARHLALT